ncbi:hypothetical protein BH23VER1_BH23VER1_06880 [soil metagenome]
MSFNPIIKKAVEAKLALEGIDWVKLQSIKLDRVNRTIDATIVLEGEPEPVGVTARYTLAGDLITLVSLETTKPWLTKAAALGLAKHGGQFHLPGGIQGTLIKMVL